MLTLDPRSVVVITGLLSLVCAIVMLLTRRGLATSIRGPGIWAGGVIVMFAATALIGRRGYWPDFLTTVVANGLLWTGMAGCIAGLYRFAGRRVPLAVLACFGMLFVGATAWYALLHPVYPARLITNAFFLLTFAAFALHATRCIEPRTVAVNCISICYAIFGGIALLRIVAVLAGIDTTASLLAPTPVQRLFLISYGLFGLLPHVAFIVAVNERQHAVLRHAATYDSLSGLFNRGAVTDMLARELDRSFRQGAPLSVLMIDIDRFKVVNDSHGHAAGDRVIADFSVRTTAQLRRFDLLSRYGGEEFLAVLPGTNIATAMQVAERIRTCAESAVDNIPSYTVSIGVAACKSGMTQEDLIAAADRALYMAKDHGRNRVMAALTSARITPLEIPAAAR